MENQELDAVLESYVSGQRKQAAQQLEESGRELYEVMQHGIDKGDFEHKYQLVSFVRIMQANAPK